MALCAATQEAVYLSRVFGSLFPIFKSNAPIIINVDNQGTIALAKNPINHQRSKHIDIKYHYVREAMINKYIELVYVPSENNVSDLMTKASSKVKLSKFSKMLCGC